METTTQCTEDERLAVIWYTLAHQVPMGIGITYADVYPPPISVTTALVLQYSGIYRSFEMVIYTF